MHIQWEKWWARCAQLLPKIPINFHLDRYIFNRIISLRNIVTRFIRTRFYSKSHRTLAPIPTHTLTHTSPQSHEHQKYNLKDLSLVFCCFTFRSSKSFYITHSDALDKFKFISESSGPVAGRTQWAQIPPRKCVGKNQSGTNTRHWRRRRAAPSWRQLFCRIHLHWNAHSHLTNSFGRARGATKRSWRAEIQHLTEHCVPTNGRWWHDCHGTFPFPCRFAKFIDESPTAITVKRGFRTVSVDMKTRTEGAMLGSIRSSWFRALPAAGRLEKRAVRSSGRCIVLHATVRHINQTRREGMFWVFLRACIWRRLLSRAFGRCAQTRSSSRSFMHSLLEWGEATRTAGGAEWKRCYRSQREKRALQRILHLFLFIM